MPGTKLHALCAAVLLLTAFAAPAAVAVGRFAASGGIPSGWRVVQLNRKVPPTTYRTAMVGGVPAVEANAYSSMALLARPITIDLAATPVLCWRWYVDAPVGAANMATKAGDDYAARLYVAFDVPDRQLSSGLKLKLAMARTFAGVRVPEAALNYVWDNRHPVGTRRKSAYTAQAEMIVAETGATRAKRWVAERADVAADFARAFPRYSGRPTQLAIASDTDNTRSRARAAFADIHFVGRNDACSFG